MMRMMMMSTITPMMIIILMFFHQYFLATRVDVLWNVSACNTHVQASSVARRSLWRGSARHGHLQSTHAGL